MRTRGPDIKAGAGKFSADQAAHAEAEAEALETQPTTVAGLIAFIDHVACPSAQGRTARPFGTMRNARSSAASPARPRAPGQPSSYTAAWDHLETLPADLTRC